MHHYFKDAELVVNLSGQNFNIGNLVDLLTAIHTGRGRSRHNPFKVSEEQNSKRLTCFFFFFSENIFPAFVQ